MLRKLLLLLFLLSARHVIAQKRGSSNPKATEKQGDAKIDYKQAGMSIPPLKLLVYQDTATKDINKDSKKILTEEDFDNGANLFVMMFNPTCSHCQDETQMLEKNIFLFKKSKLIMIATPVMTPYMPDFYKSFHIAEYPTISIGFDSSGFINNLFMYQALPQINIYDRDHKLIKIYSGEVAMDSLEKYIQ